MTQSEVNGFHTGQLGRDHIADSIADMYDVSFQGQSQYADLKATLGSFNENLWAIPVAKAKDKSESADRLK